MGIAAVTLHRMDDLSIDPSDLQGRQGYFLLTSLVVPRPIAWVSTVDHAGVRNVAPHSFFNVIATNRPVVQFVSSGIKDTLRNVRDTEEFVVNVVGEDLLEPMNLTAADFPPDQDEFDWAELTAEPSVTVKPPRVRESKAALECTLREVQEIENVYMVLGDVTHIHISGDILGDNGRVMAEKWHPVGRLDGTRYAVADDVISLPRPTFADLATQRNTDGRTP